MLVSGELALRARGRARTDLFSVAKIAALTRDIHNWREMLRKIAQIEYSISRGETRGVDAGIMTDEIEISPLEAVFTFGTSAELILKVSAEPARACPGRATVLFSRWRAMRI